MEKKLFITFGLGIMVGSAATWWFRPLMVSSASLVKPEVPVEVSSLVPQSLPDSLPVSPDTPALALPQDQESSTVTKEPPSQMERFERDIAAVNEEAELSEDSSAIAPEEAPPEEGPDGHDDDDETSPE